MLYRAELSFPFTCAQHSARPHGFGCGPQSAPLQCGCFPQCLTAAYGEACVFVCAAHRSSRSQRSMGGRSNHSTPWPTVATCALSVGAPQIALSANGTLRTSGTVASRCIRLHRGALRCAAGCRRLHRPEACVCTAPLCRCRPCVARACVAAVGQSRRCRNATVRQTRFKPITHCDLCSDKQRVRCGVS